MKSVYCLLAVLMLCGCATTHKGFVSTTGGGRIYYEERGQGEPIILLHGHSLDRRMWDEQFKPFARHHRVVRLDFRGYGLSSEQREGLQFTHADDVITLMDSLHIQRAHVVGLSMGAFVAGDMLAIFPERLITCTEASGGIRRAPPPGVPMASAERADRVRTMQEWARHGVPTMKRQWTEQLLATCGNNRERVRKPLERMINDWTAWQPQHFEVRLFYADAAWQRLRSQENTVPTLLLRGENEVKGKKGAPGELRELKNGRYVVIPDCGHMLNMERPKEFNRTVLEFINSYPAH